MEFRELLIGLAIIWLAAKVAGEAMERLGQTAVLGELLAGVVIGPGMLGLVHDSPILHSLAELGVVILLFEVGLESDLSGLLKAGVQATVAALVGVALPFAAGFVTMWVLGEASLMAVFVGAALTATSVGVTARVLSDLGRLQDPAAKVVLGAAIVDDVLGLIILAVVTGLVQTGTVSLGGVAWLTAKAGFFLLVAIMLGIRLAPRLVGFVRGLRARGTLIVYSVAFVVALAAVADAMGLATIIGAFAAGLVLATTERRTSIETRIRPVADLLVPIFFVTIGMKVDLTVLSPFAPVNHFRVAVFLTAVAIAAKLATGLVIYQRGVNRWAVGVGMIPRGEVGLIFASIGLAAGVISAELYAALVAMVMFTTFVAPPWLKALYRDEPPREQPPAPAAHQARLG